ncbi:MAG: glycosyltransferase [Fimbriimonadaceae bacterium]
MKVLLMVVGTRGDLEPFLAIGEKLQQQGHELIYCASAQLGPLVSDSEFIPLSPAFLVLLEGPQGRALMNGKLSFVAKAKAALALAKVGMKVDKELSRQQFKALERVQPDWVICHPKCSAPLPWTENRGRKLTYVSPIPYYVHADERRPHTGINGNFGPLLNRLTYRLINFALSWSIAGAARGLYQPLRMTRKGIANALLKVQFEYAISPSLYPRNPQWPANVQVVGYSSRGTSRDDSDSELREFLARTPRVLLLTFGSMNSADPERMSRVLFECIEESGVPVVVNTAAGGLVPLEPYTNHDKFLFVGSADYRGVLDQAVGIIHHGGSGKTHMGLRHGCPTLVVPHVFDQFTWGALVEELGAGPAPLAVNKLTKAKVRQRLKDLLENPQYQANAQGIAEAMRSELSSPSTTHSWP